MWVEFVVRSRLGPRVFFPGFLSPQKPVSSNSSSIEILDQGESQLCQVADMAFSLIIVIFFTLWLIGSRSWGCYPRISLRTSSLDLFLIAKVYALETHAPWWCQ